MEQSTALTARELAAQLRLRSATATLAKQQAKKRVTKLSLLAEDYLAQHREELMAKARMLAVEILRK